MGYQIKNLLSKSVSIISNEGVLAFLQRTCLFLKTKIKARWDRFRQKSYLEEKISQGNGNSYKDLMYDVAEASFMYTSRDEAHTWYKNADKFGRADALQRYEARMVHYR